MVYVYICIYFFFILVFNILWEFLIKQFSIALEHVGYEIILPNSALRASSAMCYLMSNGIIVKYICMEFYATLKLGSLEESTL